MSAPFWLSHHRADELHRTYAAGGLRICARCLGVYYAPVDEDYGLVPYEAFLSQKPVITATDAGGPLDIVRDRETGLVVEPTVEELARACTWLREHEDEARAFGRAGRDIAQAVTWDACIERLLAAVTE